MKTLRVENIRSETTAGIHTATADFSLGRNRKSIWIRSNEAVYNSSAEPFLPVALIPAMRRGWQIVLEGAVSEVSLNGANTIQQVMTGWYPNFKQVPIKVASKQAQQPLEPRAVACFFSGGVDSFYTLQQNREEISHIIFVHGFDLALGWNKERNRASQSIRDLAAELDLELVEVETNLRQFGQPHVSWPDAYYGAALASIALLLANRFRKIYIAANVSADQLLPSGSHPDLDPNWSNGNLELIIDGLETKRFDKILALSEWSAPQSHLRVCYHRSANGMNCGRCVKCLWTMMLLRALGVADTFTTFPGRLDLDRLQLYPLKTKDQVDRFEDALTLLRERGEDMELQAVLQTMLASRGRSSMRAHLQRGFDRIGNYVAHRKIGR